MSLWQARCAGRSCQPRPPRPSGAALHNTVPEDAGAMALARQRRLARLCSRRPELSSDCDDQQALNRHYPPMEVNSVETSQAISRPSSGRARAIPKVLYPVKTPTSMMVFADVSLASICRIGMLSGGEHMPTRGCCRVTCVCTEAHQEQGQRQGGT